MARPSLGYRNAAGKRVPGATTVLKYVSLSDVDMLCGWAAKLAKQGKDWREERSRAGDHGTALHELCETRLPHELDPTADRPPGMPDGTWEKLLQSYGAIRGWYVTHEPQVVFAERPLVSESYQYGGTPDGVVVFPRDIERYGIRALEPWLLDYKTGSYIGAKEVAQMAAYRQLLAETGIARVSGAILIHAPTKEPGYMRPVALSEHALGQGWLVFRAALDVASVATDLAAVCD